MDPLAGFNGTRRYRVERCLGRGGFGVVYEVFDKVRGERQALKTLRSIDGDSLYCLKREFRTLSNVSHPNLVSLYELGTADELWFYTMELVEGTDFLNFIYLKTPSNHYSNDSSFWSEPTVKEAREAKEQDSPLEAVRRPSQRRIAPLISEENLRSALSQMVQGVMALHRADLLHRDIKPSNVLVTTEGQIKIADFGLSVRLDHEHTSRELVGTVGYMAPEILSGHQADTASDWYAIGVILYEALSGRLPFDLPHPASMRGEARNVQELAPNAPPDLCDLCMDLITRDPKQRPKGGDVARRLNRSGQARTSCFQVEHMSESASLIGREEELKTLHKAYMAAKAGETVVLRVSGQPGVGKSTLVKSFLEPLEAKAETVVLRGRVFERESVPYRAVDSLMDSLTTYLRHLDGSVVKGLLPSDVRALAKLFPVMDRVESIASAPGLKASIPDRQELRRRAFHVLQEILTQIAKHQTLVIWLDDLQWSDTDSAALLSNVLGPPGLPRLLFVASYRHSEQGLSPELERALSGPEALGLVVTITLDTLNAEHAVELARTTLSTSQQKMAEVIAEESGGNPFFIVMHASYVAHHGVRLETQVTLEQVIDSQVRSLTPDAQRLLSVASLSHRQPLPLSLAREAAQLESGISDTLDLLRARHMLVTLVSSSDDEVQFFHDRIRECVIASLDLEEVRKLHFELARVLESSHPQDMEALAAHLEGARERERAACALAKAADLAAEKLAFDRAASLYGRALDLSGPSSSEQHRLRVLRGDALKNAGRGPDAAQEYLMAVVGASHSEALELRRKAVVQLLLAGHTTKGRALMMELLTEQGTRPSTSRYGILLDIVLTRARIRVRELRAHERSLSSISAEEKRRLDVTWSATWGLSVIEPLEARALQCRHLLHALKVGDPYRLARALSFEVAHASVLDERAVTSRMSQLYEKARGLVMQLDQPYTTGLWMLAKGMRAYCGHRFSDALRECDRAVDHFRANCTGVAAEIMTLRIFAACSLYYLGELSELSMRVRRSLLETRAAGDLVGSASMSGGVCLSAWLVDDDLSTARHVLEESRRRLGVNRFSHGMYWELFGDGLLALYSGLDICGYKKLRSRWPAFKETGMNLVPVSLVPTLHLRGALAVAYTAKAKSQRVLRDANRCAHGLESHSELPGTVAMASFIKAAIEHQRGRRALARDHLATAEEESLHADLGCFVAVARLRRGTLFANVDGGTLAREAMADMRALGVKRPDRFAQLIAPGFPDPPTS